VIPLVYAQSLSPTGESETETEQEIKQKNVCSDGQYERILLRMNR
jgi:hypothetical protein